MLKERRPEYWETEKGRAAKEKHRVIIEVYLRTGSLREAGRSLGVTGESVRQVLVLHGVRRRPRYTWSKVTNVTKEAPADVDSSAALE